jgi:hypothetical protein
MTRPDAAKAASKLTEHLLNPNDKNQNTIPGDKYNKPNTYSRNFNKDYQFRGP